MIISFFLSIPCRILGCPCSGPGWYKAYVRWASRVTGEPIPPEAR